MELKLGCKWLFAEELKGKTTTLEFVEAKPYMARDGKPCGEVLCLIGPEGDYQVFPGRISNMRSIIKALGAETTKWAGKRFNVTSDDGVNIQINAI
jgi:hypothetical protein